MKLIDADKLRAEIERRRLSNRYIDTEGYEAELFEIIDSLQQQQEEPDESLEEEIREYMSNEDNNPFDWDWRDKRDCARHFAEWGAGHLKK